MTTGRRASAAARVTDAVLEASIVGSFTNVGYRVRHQLFGWNEPEPGSLQGQVVLVTGATSGLGLELALEFARLGATTIVWGRDPGRTETARAAVQQGSSHGEVHAVVADLNRLGDVRRAAEEIASHFNHLDVLVHNAGALVHRYEETEDGIEVTAQTHVVAPQLLTTLVWPLLTRSAAGRVIAVTSGGMYTARLDVDTLSSADHGRFDGVRHYALAKRAQVVLTGEWARRTSSSGVSFQAMHPGWCDTPGVHSSLPAFHRLVRPLLRSPAQGVDTTLWLACDNEPRAANGRLWLDRRPRRTTYLPHTATTAAEAERLWEWCRHAASLDVPGPETRSDTPAQPTRRVS